MANTKYRYDTSVKELLADKQVLARILKYSLEEFKNYSFNEIMAMIDEPEVGNIFVEPGLSNLEKAKLLSTEDSVPNEGKIVYDIRFNAYLGKDKIKIIINIEAQKSSNPKDLKYHLDNRNIFYLSRLISSQKDVEFKNSNYDDIKCVKSIWICMDGDDDTDSINRFSFKKESIYGKDIELPKERRGRS